MCLLRSLLCFLMARARATDSLCINEGKTRKTSEAMYGEASFGVGSALG